VIDNKSNTDLQWQNVSDVIAGIARHLASRLIADTFVISLMLMNSISSTLCGYPQRPGCRESLEKSATCEDERRLAVELAIELKKIEFKEEFGSSSRIDLNHPIFRTGHLWYSVAYLRSLTSRHDSSLHERASYL